MCMYRAQHFSCVGAKMLEYQTILGVAVSLGCGFGIGWMFRGRRRYQSLKNEATTNQQLETSEVGEGGECKLVLVVRNDLKMGKGKVAAQCSHAAVMAYEQLVRRHPDLLKEWKCNGQPKVVLRIKDETSLMELAAHANSKGLLVSLVRDAGRTQIAPGSKTVVGIGPGPIEVVDSVTGHLKLY